MNAEKLTTPKEKVRKLQRKLYQSAKRNKMRKFHVYMTTLSGRYSIRSMETGESQRWKWRDR